MDITFSQVKLNTPRFTLNIENWHISPGQSWGIFSTDGDIGSLVGDLLCSETETESGDISGMCPGIEQVSLVEQQRLLEAELADDDTDFLDRIDTGTDVYSMVARESRDPQLTARLIDELDLHHLKKSGFRTLSTGETRRLMLARVLARQPQLLILDEPYAGLDKEHRQRLSDYLSSLAKTMQLIVVVSRENEMPDWVSSIALFQEGTLTDKLSKEEWDNHPVIAQISAQSKERSEQLLSLIHKHQHSSRFPDPLFKLSDGRVAYTDSVIFSGINWQIKNGEHWQIRGPNGCGKSTLLGMIFGDHPQCYSNDIEIFGRQRGSGETIWDIKKNIGIVSSALHLQYRVNCSALEVVLSGFYDSIGMYSQPTRKEMEIAREWLAILHMTPFIRTPFRKLDYGQQRLLLIARALVKQPALLILDEPYQGLDSLGRRLVMNTIDIIAGENLSQILYVSHYQEDSLKSIRNFVDFVPEESGKGYGVNITRK